LEKRKHHGFLRPKLCDVLAQFFLDFLSRLEDKRIAQIAIENFRMDVAFAADGGCVPQSGGDCFDCVPDIPYRGGFAVEFLVFR
jgi:hypothetical protein